MSENRMLGHGRDWRLERLREVQRTDRRLAPMMPAFIVANDLLGHYVVRPGVPDFVARKSWHLTRRRAERVAAAWNEVLNA